MRLMEEKQEKNKIVEFGNKVGKKASEIGDKFSETAKQTFDHLNVLKYFTESDKNISDNETEKSIEFLNTVNNIKDEKIKAGLLNNYMNSNDQKEIKKEKMRTIKYLSATVGLMVLTAFLNQNNKKL